jgi:hypothetical protein
MLLRCTDGSTVHWYSVLKVYQINLFSKATVLILKHSINLLVAFRTHYRTLLNAVCNKLKYTYTYMEAPFDSVFL